MAFTWPSEFTVAISGSEETQTSFLLPGFSGLTVGFLIVLVFPILIEKAVSPIGSIFSIAFATVTLQVAFLGFSLCSAERAVIVAFPVLIAVKCPFSSTVTTSGSSEDQRISLQNAFSGSKITVRSV